MPAQAYSASGIPVRVMVFKGKYREVCRPVSGVPITFRYLRPNPRYQGGGPKTNTDGGTYLRLNRMGPYSIDLGGKYLGVRKMVNITPYNWMHPIVFRV